MALEVAKAEAGKLTVTVVEIIRSCKRLAVSDASIQKLTAKKRGRVGIDDGAR